jgi:hypothetical protein
MSMTQNKNGCTNLVFTKILVHSISFSKRLKIKCYVPTSFWQIAWYNHFILRVGQGSIYIYIYVTQGCIMMCLDVVHYLYHDVFRFEFDLSLI